ncbi:MAG: biotin/lipoyl-containing protein, partial [Vitreimonas sp.]
MTNITMPALSPTMEEGNLAKWHVKAGDKIEPGQVIAEIETDKATMEVEAVDEGVIGEILVPEGTEGVKVNTPIATLQGDAQSSPPPRGAGGGGRSEQSAAANAAPAPTSTTTPNPERPPTPTPPPQGGRGDARIFASPLARRLAEQGGIDLSGLRGSGPNGRIVKSDIEAAVKSPQPRAPQASQPES